MDLLGKDTWWAADIERIFLGLYTVELLIRLTAGGREAFHNSWFLCLGRSGPALAIRRRCLSFL